MARKPTQSEWADISRWFNDLAGQPVEVQNTRLARLGADPFVIDQVRTLLAADSDAGVLDRPISPATVPVGEVDYASLAAGTAVGAFAVERLIGRGGMGEVYLAHRAAAGFEQRVALKLLRPEAVGRARLFDVERRLLAGLEHPGIARLIDGGIAPDGRPYMALEYVEGQEIGAWCTAHDADLASRLRLFLELCAAVEYAHARLVLHLDIKPSNILVDTDDRARLLDFGVARIIETTALDRMMTQALLTPDYAAPEQFGDGSPTVATDVYGLGAVLFELLTARGPWDFGDAPLPTVLRRLLHDDPPYPSKVAVGEIPATRLAGDLDAIVMKAMRRNPADRYASVAALAADVRRFQAFEPVAARTGTMTYRARRFLRRNRWTAGAATAALLLLLVGAGGIAWQSRQTRLERDIARAEAERSEAVNQAMLTMFSDASDTGRTETANARDLIDHTANRLVTSLDPAAPKSSTVIGAMADLYVIVDNPIGGQKLLETALARGIGRNDPVAQAQLRLKLAAPYAAAQRYPEARALLAQAEAVWRTDPARFRRERAEAVGDEAAMLRLEGKRPEAIDLLLRTLPEAEAVLAGNSRDLAIRYANLTLHLVEANRLDEAEAILNRSERRLANTGQAQSPAGLQLMQMRGGIASRQGDTAGAARIFGRTAAIQRSLYGKSMGLAVDLMQYGRVLNQLGKFPEALTALDEAEPMAIAHSGPKSPPTVMIGISRADALTGVGRLNEAKAALDRITPGAQASGPANIMNGARLQVLSKLELKRGDPAASETALNAAAAIFDKLGPTAQVFARGVAPIRAQIAAARAK